VCVNTGLLRAVQAYRCLPDVQLVDLEDVCAKKLSGPLLGAATNRGAADADRMCHIQVTLAPV
jgi:hypothetical protein